MKPKKSWYKTLVRWFLRLIWGLDVENESVLAQPGPVLLLPNHVSWFDWLLMAVVVDDDWRFATSITSAKTSWFHRVVMVNKFTFPVENDSPYAVKRMAEFLQGGGRLVLFPEGRLSQTGSLMKLFDGTGFLLYKTNARVITCYLRNAKRLPLSPNLDNKKWFPRISLHFSEVLTPPKPTGVSTTQARIKLTAWLRQTMVGQQFQAEMEKGPGNVLSAIVQNAADFPSREILEDVMRAPLSYRKLMVGADLISRQLGRSLSDSELRVGVLLPNVMATPVLLLAIWSLGKVPAILNFSTGGQVMKICAELAGLKTIVTSRLFVERAKLDLEPLRQAGIRFLFLEELRREIRPLNKLEALLRSFVSPRHLDRQAASALNGQAAVVLFTSGSEGMPKGVELSHRNILANIRQMLAVTDLQEVDKVFNSLPLFHSFGLTVGLLLGLVRGLPVFIYPSPLHYRVVPTVFYDTNSTVFLSTNTFLNGYARKAHAYDFRSLRYLFAAAEKLQEATASFWSKQFGVRILEGYGATECSPCVSLNTPLEPREGSVGKLMPGMEYRLEKVDGVEEGGRLFVRGPNLMRGYLNREANEKFLADNGWYDTGDIVRVDDDGYFYIVGRLKRFAKISGEMVSLTAVEEALAGAFPQYGLRCQVAVISRPDEEKGEALVAVANEPKLNLDEVRGAIKAAGLSNLCIPREIKVVKEIPKLGTGKVNHRELLKLLS